MIRVKPHVPLSCLVVVAAIATASITLWAQQPDPQTAVNAAFTKYQNLKEGKNADYIPALAKVNPALFGIVCSALVALVLIVQEMRKK